MKHLSLKNPWEQFLQGLAQGDKTQAREACQLMAVSAALRVPQTREPEEREKVG